MFTWFIRLTYVGIYGDTITQCYLTKADNDIIALDKALSQFWIDTGLNFDDDIENINWTIANFGG